MNDLFPLTGFLRKTIPTTLITQESMAHVAEDISSYVNLLIAGTNELSDTMLLSLDAAAACVRATNHDLRPITSLLADVYLTGGASRDSVDIFRPDLITQEDGVILDRDTLQVRLARRPAIIHAIKDLTIDTVNGRLGNSLGDKRKYFEPSNAYSRSTQLEIESFGSPLEVALILDLGEKRAVNSLSFNLANFGVQYPIIDSVAVADDDCGYSPVILSASNSTSLHIEDFHFTNGEITVHFAEVYKRFIKINVIQQFPYSTGKNKEQRYAIGINKLKASFQTSEQSGELIVGPIKTQDEIFKIGINSAMSRFDLEEENIRLAISIDKEVWIPVQNSAVFDPESLMSKIVNFNTIDDNANSTNEIVVSFYLRVEMTGIDVSNKYPDGRYINRNLMMISRNANTGHVDGGNGEDFQKVYKESGTRFGSDVRLDRISVPGGIRPQDIVHMSIDGEPAVKGLRVEGEAVVDVTRELAITTKNLLVGFGYDKVHVTNHDLINNKPSMGFDPFNISLFGLSLPLQTEVHVDTVNNRHRSERYIPVIPVKQKAGQYTLRYPGGAYTLDLSEKMFFDNSQTLYAVPNDTTRVEVQDELGEHVGNITPTDINGTKYISLAELFCPLMPTHNGREYATWYPIVPLGEDQYVIVKNEALFGTYYNGAFPLIRSIKNTITPNTGEDITESTITSSTSKQIKAKYQLLGDDLKRTIKLKHTNIVDQSVTFDMSAASINALTREVPFINGKDEFVIAKDYFDVDNKNKTSITLHPKFIDDNKLSFKTCDHLFKRRVYSLDELIDKGEYFLDDSVVPNVIHLPEGLATSAASDTQLRYSIEPSRQSISGLYSINHTKGILYTVTPIDGLTAIQYQYSNVYGKYSGLQELNTNQYTRNGTVISIQSESDVAEPHLVLTSGKTESSIDYIESPVLYDFNLNIIDASGSI